MLYESTLNIAGFEGYELHNILAEFLTTTDVILANRMHTDLENVKAKVYTRDLFGDN